MADLSTSRINRQLRSLRMKCTSLSSLSLSQPKPAVSVTYGSSHRNVSKRPQDDDGTPPLAILQSLDNFGARLHLDRAIVENMQLSKRIYEVRDAFRNIVQSISGTPKNDEVMERQRVSPLTSICARLIGEHVQSEIEAAMDDLQDSDSVSDEHGTQAMDALYEQVPPSYRSHMFIAHALTYTLEACPHYPTLLSALLEVCLSHNLVPEAHTILAHLFAVAVKPRVHSTYACPLTHPAHKNFLSTLRESCSASVINDRTFTRILLDTLSEPTTTRLHAWTSKAVTRLARDLRERDFDGCFVPLCTGLVRAVAVDKSRAKVGRKGGKTPEDLNIELRDGAVERLAKWTISMLDRLHASTSDATDEYRACVDFLVDAAPHGLHERDDPPASPPACLADALVCLAAYCLASRHSTSLHQQDVSTLEGILRSAHVKNTTFDGLVSHIFPLPRFELFAMPLAQPEGANTPTPPPTPPDVHGDAIEALSALAIPLRRHGLLKCEAALWLAALQHVEELIAAPTVTQSMTTPGRKLSQSQLYNLRLEMMDRVEEAERRCFGGEPGGGIAGAAPPGDGEWEWEEMVGSWVLKSPAPALAKRAKDCRASERRTSSSSAPLELSRPAAGSLVREALTAARQARSAQEEASASACRSTPVRTGNALKRKASSASATSGRTAPRAGSSKENSSDDEENVAPPRKASRPNRDPAMSPPPPPRRASNFATILADAQMNVISLRAEREAKAKAKARATSKAPTRRPFPALPPPTSISAPPAPIAAWRRQSNFTTLLADSQRNVISLREERARKAQQALRFGPPSSQDTMSDEEDEEVDGWQSERDPESSPVRGAGFVHPSSDDALNLFAYPDSSPARRR